MNFMSCADVYPFKILPSNLMMKIFKFSSNVERPVPTMLHMGIFKNVSSKSVQPAFVPISNLTRHVKEGNNMDAPTGIDCVTIGRRN